MVGPHSEEIAATAWMADSEGNVGNMLAKIGWRLPKDEVLVDSDMGHWKLSWGRSNSREVDMDSMCMDAAIDLAAASNPILGRHRPIDPSLQAEGKRNDWVLEERDCAWLEKAWALEVARLTMQKRGSQRQEPKRHRIEVSAEHRRSLQVQVMLGAVDFDSPPSSWNHEASHRHRYPGQPDLP